VPALRALKELRFDAPVTFLMGENGCGKCTSGSRATSSTPRDGISAI
jgi:predicted ATPase